jgi:Mlc titration factor MtfA (ptsG expression regulator)
MLTWLHLQLQRLRKLGFIKQRNRTIPDAMWQRTLRDYPFLTVDPANDSEQLRAMVVKFLGDKEFNGAHGLPISDAMAVAIAAQACLPVLHLGLHWYDDFKGIVVHPGAMLARRVVVDAAGVVHHFKEALSGEAMQHGPVTLSWADVAASGDSAQAGHNIVIHEFVHKLDMRTGSADGCPPLPSRLAWESWRVTMQASYVRFQAKLTMAERFGAEPPWLDAYAATAPAEFFAVTSEAYFVNRGRFAQEFPELLPLFAQFFNASVAP